MTKKPQVPCLSYLYLTALEHTFTSNSWASAAVHVFPSSMCPPRLPLGTARNADIQSAFDRDTLAVPLCAMFKEISTCTHVHLEALTRSFGLLPTQRKLCLSRSLHKVSPEAALCDWNARGRQQSRTLSQQRHEALIMVPCLERPKEEAEASQKSCT